METRSGGRRAEASVRPTNGSGRGRAARWLLQQHLEALAYFIPATLYWVFVRCSIAR